jgi:hypothetical protein
VAILAIAMGGPFRCGLIQWCEGAARLASVLPAEWEVQLVVIGRDSAAAHEVSQ